MENFLFAIAALTGVVILLSRTKDRGWRSPAPALLLGAWGIGAFLVWSPSVDSLRDSLPQGRADGSYVSSDTCRGCHPDQYDSWSRSYHRTMTQVAGPDTVLADFDDVELRARGRRARAFRRGDEFWVDSVDPVWEMELVRGLVAGPASQARRVEERVVMTTGSHHLQAYWTYHETSGMLFQFPWVYHIAERRWIPSDDSFLRPPPSGGGDPPRWNRNCISCHAVAGQPRINPDDRTMFSRTAELGIACEACHGPAQAHVEANRNPARRYRFHLTEGHDPTIVNPEKLDARRASDVCANCHSAGVEVDEERWRESGRGYLPGDKLEETRRLFRFADLTQGMKLGWEGEDASLRTGYFWPDGTARVAGREHLGLLETGCYLRGELSCLSCHSMHESDPADQIKAGMEGDGACLSCHSSYRDRAEEHTHHEPGSSGSLCTNCHMPHTTYGLFKAIRSHRIDSPVVADSFTSAKPNACNACHLDRSLAWSSRHLARWYGRAEVQLDDDETQVRASLLWLLRGDAAQRAVTAWAMGWQPALAISGTGWQAPYLAVLLEDPYSVVRLMAYNSLRKQPGFHEFAYDFVASSEERASAKRRALEIWQGSPSRMERPEAAADLIERLLPRRDDRPLMIIE